MPVILYELPEVAALIGKDLDENHPEVARQMKKPLKASVKVTADKTGGLTAHGIVVPIGDTVLPESKGLIN